MGVLASLASFRMWNMFVRHRYGCCTQMWISGWFKGFSQPNRCFQLFWLTVAPLRLKLGGAESSSRSPKWKEKKEKEEGCSAPTGVTNPTGESGTVCERHTHTALRMYGCFMGSGENIFLKYGRSAMRAVNEWMDGWEWMKSSSSLPLLSDLNDTFGNQFKNKNLSWSRFTD